jgi:hypothetical protein
MARWGLLANRHGTSLINFNFNPPVCFYDYFLHGLYGPSYVKQILSGVKNSNDSIETRHDNFSHLYSKSCEHSVVCEKEEKLKEEMMLRQLPTADWRKTFTRGGETAWALKCHAIQVVLITNFK